MRGKACTAPSGVLGDGGANTGVSASSSAPHVATSSFPHDQSSVSVSALPPPPAVSSAIVHLSEWSAPDLPSYDTRHDLRTLM